MRILIWTILLAGAAAPAAAQPALQERPEALTRVTGCRAIQSSAERLACYDESVAALDAAQSSNQLVVVDRSQIRRARRSIFGLTLPDLDIFSGGDDEEEEVATLETTIRSATQNGFGKWIVILADGARWIQVDTRELARDPRPGDTIRIRRAAMGSYLANIGRQIAIRMRRER